MSVHIIGGHAAGALITGQRREYVNIYSPTRIIQKVIYQSGDG